MKSHAYHAHIFASSHPEYIGVSLAPLKTVCYVNESRKDESNIGDEKILILLEKLREMGGIEKKFKINFEGFISSPSCCASLAKIFYNFFNVGEENILKCLLEMDVKSVVSFLGGFSFIGENIQRFFLEKIGMLMIKNEGEEKPSKYVEEMKYAILAEDIERIGILCEKVDVPATAINLKKIVCELREKGIQCYLSLGTFPLIITYPEIIGEVINVLQVRNFDVEIVSPANQKDV